MNELGPVPYLEHFTVKWDPLTGEWIATSPSGRFQLRGRNEAELMAERWRLCEAVADCRAVIAELFPLRRM